MVMKRNAMRKNLRQSIRRSLGRYIAIMMIIALGAGLFVGLRMTKADMVATGQRYADEQNMFDLRLMTSYGWDDGQLEQIRQLEGLVDVEGIFYIDTIVSMNGEDDAVYRFYNIPETLNRLVLSGGRWPEAPNECLIDGFHLDDSILGSQVTVSSLNDEDTLDTMVYETYTVVGYAGSPLYMDMNRGTTSVGNGSISNCFYVPREGLSSDYYTEIHVTIPGDYDLYTDAYNEAMEAMAEKLEPLLEPLAAERLVNVLADAEEAYAEGLAEYEDGLKEFEREKEKALNTLQDAYEELMEGWLTLQENEQLLIDGEKQIADGRTALAEGRQTLEASKKTLSNAKADAYKELSESTQALMKKFGSLTEQLQEVESELTAITAESSTLAAKILPLEAELTMADAEIAQTNSMIGILDIGISAAVRTLELARENGADEGTLKELEEELAALQEQKGQYETTLAQQQADRDAIMANLTSLYEEQKQLQQRQSELEDKAGQIEDSMNAITTGLMELVVTQSVMDNEFAAAEAQIEAAESMIEEGLLELDIQEQNIADGWVQLEAGRLELEAGWKEYESGREEAYDELASAQREIEKGAETLADARETIDAMTENDLFVLDRNTNVGYVSLDSASDIVEGVSRVFPAFFLLVAALVCITTMTRMVEEERTQIGTLKALGYSNFSIINKYLSYAGTGALLGCGLGVLMGSMIFPLTLWQAYEIMLYIPRNMALTFDPWLCFGVVGMYTAVMLAVTWYCCHRALEEEPAELIRPKTPDVAKPLVFERMRLWNRLSFLNKVTIRNIFRYRQRLAMMMVGIGGCTALLVTGFGLRDSIVNVVDFQFSDITHYDLQVYFNGNQSEIDKLTFQAEVGDNAKNLMFYHQSSVELDYDNQVREIYLIAGDDQLHTFIDFHSGPQALELPGENEVMLTVGAANAMGIRVGDRVILRGSDMRELDVTVSGIYDNHVDNFAIIRPETIQAQWQEKPEVQMAFVQVADGYDIHKTGAKIAGSENVMNVSVSADLADMVANMMEALDLVVVIVVFCAGLLASIVLYNLTNININERIREIATIKVLGFNASETAAYVFKENMTLSVVGSVVGLFLGKLLLNFVMTQIKINMVWFQARVMPGSYGISFALTILAACIVNFIFYFKLETINMAEALKSVE